MKKKPGRFDRPCILCVTLCVLRTYTSLIFEYMY